MNWIDKIFKDQLGSRKFPDELRNKGKADLEFLLAREMPVTAAKAGKGGLFYGGLSILILALVAVPVGIWYFQAGDMDGKASYSLNFGQPNDAQSEIVMEAKAGTSGSWNAGVTGVVSKEVTHPEDVHETSGDIVKNENNGSNVSAVVESSEIHTADSKPINHPKGEAYVASSPKVVANYGDALKSGASAEKVATTKPATANDANKADGASGTVADKLPAEPDFAGPVEIKNDEGTADIAAIENETATDWTQHDPPDAIGESVIDYGTEKPQQAEDERSASANAELSIAENSPEGGLVKKESEAQQEDNNPDGETADQLAEEGAVSTGAKPTIALKTLSNLAFSGVQGNTTPDLSQYKSLSPKQMAVSIWGGYTYVGKTVKGGNQEYLDLRKEKEDAIWTTPTGLTFDYYLTKNWTLSIGAGYSEYGEDLNYDYEYQRKGFEDGRYGSPANYSGITRLDSVRVITNINEGHWDYYFDYTETDTAIRDNNGQTHWSYIEIPVMVGYRFGIGKLKPWLQCGVSLGIPYNQTFRYLSPSGEGLQTRQESQAAATDLQLSGNLKLGVDWYLTRHISLRANAFGSYQLSPAYSFDGIEQKYYRLGGTVGVAYNF